MVTTATCDICFIDNWIPLCHLDQHTLAMKWYSVSIVVFCLWYICFVCFYGILLHGVLWISPLHYLFLFANKSRIVLVSCDLEANSNTYPNILIFPCECCRIQILLLWNCQFWLVLVSSDVPMLLMCFWLVFSFGHGGKLRRLLLLMMMLRHAVVFAFN